MDECCFRGDGDSGRITEDRRGQMNGVDEGVGGGGP